MASLYNMQQRIEWARSAYSARNYNHCWELLFSVVVDGDACCSQREINKIDALCSHPSTRYEGFRQLGSLASTAIENMKYARQERYTREFTR